MRPVWSSRYRQMDDPEVFLERQCLLDLMAQFAPDDHAPAFTTVADVFEAAQQWMHHRQREHSALLQHAASQGLAHAGVQQLLMHSAPMGLTLGSPLQNMSAPGVFDNVLHLRLLALLADDLGLVCRGNSRTDEFRVLLRRLGLPAYAVSRAECASLRDIDDAAFALPSTVLALSRRSDCFGPELCGIDLFLRAVRTLPCWTAIREHHSAAAAWHRLDLGCSGEASNLDPLSTVTAIAEQLCRDQTLGARLLAAARWMHSALHRWDEWLLSRVRRSLQPSTAMGHLIQQRARDAAVYHNRFRLGGCPLSEHFKRAANDPEPLLAELARSGLVKPGASANSVLVNGLIAPEGKMFRVFTPDEIQIMKRWIDTLPESQPRETSSLADTYLAGSDRPALETASTEAVGDVAPQDIRDAYHLLQGRALTAKMRQFATGYVHDWMQRARRENANADCALPKSWPKSGLRDWLQQQHEQADASFQQNNAAELPSREAVIDSSLQLAPLLCIDGAWLQGFTDTELATSVWGRALVEIYWDELGNGLYELNHPKIYRDLLRQMGAELAPTGSREFAQDPRLRDASFDLPVLWLCLGKLPRSFLPEILGLNLAMELSGVGGGYRAAHRFLQHYGFNTHFVDLHNTIDNVATGHSAWAADAVDAYMATQSRLTDDAVVHESWTRVRTGFKALTAPPKHRWTTQLSDKLRRARQRRPKHRAVPLHHQWTPLESRI